MADTQFIIKSDSPVNDQLMFWSLVGHETLSRPATYELTVLSTNEKIDAKDVLGRGFDVVIEFADADGGKHERHCQGHAVRFMRRGSVGRYFEYRFTLRSWFWLLTKRSNSRILQDKPVLDVLDAVFEDSPIKRFKKLKTDHVIGSHPARRYCVQHQESDYQYLSRLLEDEGIYYWFDAHDAPGTMHLSDASDVAHAKLPVTDTLRYVPAGATEARHNEIGRWIDSRRLDTGKFASRDSDFKAVRKKLSADKGDPDVHELADLEAFEFPGGYFGSDDTEETAKVRMEELAARRGLNWAVTRWPDVAVGRSFTFEGHPAGEPDGDHFIASCAFVVTHPGYEGLGENDGKVHDQGQVLLGLLQDDPVNADWQEAVAEIVRHTPDLASPVRGTGAFLLTVLPAQVLYRTPRLTPRVTMPGPQSAIVVGPKGEEIHADDFGRVKVHFHWDRYDESDEKSTCWVRVSQPWAGKGWGGYFIPRIGQEVVVDFLNGDPDRPIIVGRVYNDDQPIPFDSHTQSGFRTRSTPKGSASNFNELRFEDKKGEEQVYVHAEKNLDTVVENDETRDVGNDRTSTIHNNEKLVVDADRDTHVKGHFTELIDTGEDRTVHAGFDEKIDGGETRQVDGGFKETVNGGVTQTINGGETRTVNGGVTETINGGETRTINGAQTETITGALTQTVTGGITATTAGAYTITATGGLTVLAPGGVKYIDSFFNKLGGSLFETYGSILKFTPMATEGTGFKAETCGIKIDTGALLNGKIGTAMWDLGVKMENAGPVMNKAALVMQKAGLFMVG